MTTSSEECTDTSLASYTFEDVSTHRSRDDKWLVVDGVVFDVSSWQYQHPGGRRVLGYFAGQDATDVVRAIHNDWPLVKARMNTLKVGRIVGNINQQGSKPIADLERDFRELRETLERLGLFKSDPKFHILQILQFLVLELMAFYTMRLCGVNWISFTITILLLTTSQIQSGWTQHDYGHSSVLPSTKLNRLVHQLIMGHFKGASSHWWRYRHFRHHARPNCSSKDPDIKHEYIFLVDEQTAATYGRERWGFMPYDWQHIYFWFLGPPTILSTFFQMENTYFIFRRKKWLELCLIASFFVRFFISYVPLLGFILAGILYMTVRVLEGYWLVMVTQSNHISMESNHDWNSGDFISTQCGATCNIEQTSFNDWFTGLINFHIEHHRSTAVEIVHELLVPKMDLSSPLRSARTPSYSPLSISLFSKSLFPTMPRHNYVKAAPYVQSLFRKHNLPYVVKPLFTAMKDMVSKLKACGRVWREEYESASRRIDENSLSNKTAKNSSSLSSEPTSVSSGTPGVEHVSLHLKKND